MYITQQTDRMQPLEALVMTTTSSTKGDSSGMIHSFTTLASTSGGGSLTLTSSGTAATPSSSSSSTGGPGPMVKVVSISSWFTTEIQQMMYGFGDCRRSLHESAVLVEEIVHQQMSSLLLQAAEVASMRGTRFVGLEDILFLLRKDKVKLRRLLRYLELKDLKIAALRDSGIDEDNNSAEGGGDAKPLILKRRRKVCYDFLASIDQTGELVSLFDDPGVDLVKHERLVRAELMARNMDPQQYTEFCEARQANFSRRYKSQRFKDWLMAGVNPDIKPNPQALEVISYLAYETVAQIVDLALIVKQDQRVIHSDPMSRTMPHVIHNYHDLQAGAQYISQAKLGVPQSPGRAEGLQTPPATPAIGATAVSTATTTHPLSSGTLLPSLIGSSAISSGSSVGGMSQSGITSASSQTANLSRLSKKKQKRSGPVTTLETSWNAAIMPADVREAMRRYSEDIGPFASVTKIRDPFIGRYRLLCT